MNNNLKILLVEDDEADVGLVHQVLSRALPEYELSVCRDGVEALDHLSATVDELPDFMILDLNLPRVSGHHVLKEIRANDELKKLPVIVLSTSFSQDDTLRAYGEGANLYLTKPNTMIDIHSLAEAVKSFWQTAKDFPHSIQFIRQTAENVMA